MALGGLAGALIGTQPAAAMGLSADGRAAAMPAHGSDPSRPEVALAPISLRTVERLFSRLSAGTDGRLDMATLRRAADNPAFRGVDAAIIATMILGYDSLIARRDDEWFSESVVTGADVAGLAGTDFGTHVARLQAQIAHARRDLFAAGPASVSGGVVTQGGVGDCYFVAALSGLADANPNAIREMVCQVAPGRYRVQLPGRPATTVSLTDSQIGLYAQTGGNGVWAAVIERAYARLEAQATPERENSDYDAVAGGKVAQGVQALTGTPTTSQCLGALGVGLDEPTMVRQLEQAFVAQPPKVVVAGIRAGIVGDQTWEGGLAMKHAYTVRSMDPRTRQIEVRNPSGKGGPHDDGIYHLSPAQFHRIFDFLAIQGR